MAELTLCRGCGKRIFWGVTDDGKKVPLDPTPPTYYLGDLISGGTFKIMRSDTCYVSHFATCSHANEFSGSRKKL